MEEFNTSLHAHTDDPAVIAHATVTVLRAVADAQYETGNLAQARAFYNQAVAADPSHIPTRAKRALLATGSMGRRLRTAAARLRGDFAAA